MKLPIFPLPIYLLPGGITRLRIFEQRYLKMVRDANKTKGFVILYNKGDDQSNDINWGSWVEIIDFNQQSDGVLSIDVMCKSLVEIYDNSITENTIAGNNDKLLIASVTLKEHWHDISSVQIPEMLTQQLKHFFIANPDFDELYKVRYFDDPLWVCRRWLELVPVNILHKQYFVENLSFQNAVGFLESLLLANSKELD